MLAELVKAGKLPAIEERLPEEPFVVGPGVYMTEENLPDWTPGKYGGTLRGAHSSANWAPDIFVAVNEPVLMAPKIGDQGIVGNVVKDYEVSDDNKVFTFHTAQGPQMVRRRAGDHRRRALSPGKISSGNDKDLPDLPRSLQDRLFSPMGNPGKLEIVDDFTFKSNFRWPLRRLPALPDHRRLGRLHRTPRALPLPEEIPHQIHHDSKNSSPSWMQ